MLWVRVPPEPLNQHTRPRGAAWSARHSVTVEITGSNPVGDACYRSARYANRKSGEAQTFVTLSVGSTPTRATLRVVLLMAACKVVVAKQVRWMTRGSIPSRPTLARSSIGIRTSAPQAGKAGSILARVSSPTANRAGEQLIRRKVRRWDG